MNYTTLIAAKTTDGSIKNWVNWGLVPSEVVLAEAERWIYSRLRVRAMLALSSDPLTIGAEYLTLPTGYRATLSLRRHGASPGVIKLRDHQLFEQQLYTAEDGTLQEGCPTEASPSADRLELNLRADQEYPIRWWYYRALTALSGSNTTNFLTDDYPHLLRCACLYRAFDHLKQWGASDRNRQQAEQYVNEANVEWDMERQEWLAEIHWGDRE